MAKPAHVPTEEQRATVTELVAAGVPVAAIGRIIKLSERTLYRHYADELKAGREVANGRVALTAYRLALSGDCPAATFFWLKTRAGWRETQRLQVELSELPDNELIAAAAGIIAGACAPGSEDGEADTEED